MTSSIPLTRQQEDILEQFRRQVFQEGILREGDSIWTDDLTLLRFLRARKFDLKEAKKMIKDAQHWRRTVAGVGIDELYNRLDVFNYPGREQVFRSWSMYFHKTDKMGRPLNIEFLGGCDLPELYKHITPDKHWETIVTTTETLVRKIIPAASRAAGHDIGGVFVIVDLKGFGYVFDHFSDYRSSYRMFMYRKITIQREWPSLLSSMHHLHSRLSGSDYQGVLLELVDAESLPATLGGKCTCEHAGGCDLSGAGPWMDEGLARSTRETNHTFTVDTGADSSLSSSEPVSEPDGNRGSSAQLVGDVADRSSNVNSGVNTSSDDTAL